MKHLLSSTLVLMLATLTAGCAVDSAPDEESVAEAQESLAGESYFYLRCNATGWGVDSATRLLPFAGSGVVARVYDVTAPWMVSGNDTCSLTQTNQLDGWGTSQTYYTTADGGPLVVPGSEALSVGSANFGVDYSTLGQHRVIVNTNASPPTIQIDSKASACAGVCPGGLTCSLMANGIPTCAP